MGLKDGQKVNANGWVIKLLRDLQKIVGDY